jgi:hypothetical protein
MIRLTVSIAMVLCASAVQAASFTPYNLSAHQIELIERHIAGAMPDPESAKFRGLEARRSDKGEIIVCGFFNGKNQLGGYAGFVPFIGVLTDTFVIGNYGGSSSENVAVAHVCRSYGIDL